MEELESLNGSFNESGTMNNSSLNYEEIMDENQNGMLETGLQGHSPDSKRLRTCKDYETTIRNLEKENFQLRLRIYMYEDKIGLKGSGLGFTKSPKNATPESLGSAGSCTSIPINPSVDVIMSQMSSLHAENASKILTLETRLHNSDVALKEKEKEVKNANDKIEELQTQLQDLQTELTLLMLKSQSENNEADAKMCYNGNVEKEIERGAFIAFGDLDEVQELEDRLQARSEQIEYLKREVDTANQENCKLLASKSSLESKVFKLSKVVEKLSRQLKDKDAELHECKHDFKNILDAEHHQRNVIEAQVSKLKAKIGLIDRKSYKNCEVQCSLGDGDVKNPLGLSQRVVVSEEALRCLHEQHAKLIDELKVLKRNEPRSIANSTGYSSYSSNPAPHSNTKPVDLRSSESTSPDLGIDSGHDAATNSDDNVNYKDEYCRLKKNYKELATKMRRTKDTLDKTYEKLNQTTQHKNQVEKAICRQLHKTHTILREAKKSLQNPSYSHQLEDLPPKPCSS